MNKLPQTASIRTLKVNPNEVFKQASNGPVIIMSRATPKGVFLLPEQWDSIAELIEDQEDLIEALKVELAIAQGEEEVIRVDDADAFVQEMMEDKRVPA